MNADGRLNWRRRFSGGLNECLGFNLIFHEDRFQTLSIKLSFAVNALNAKEKGLVEIEEPCNVFSEISLSTPKGRII